MRGSHGTRAARQTHGARRNFSSVVLMCALTFSSVALAAPPNTVPEPGIVSASTAPPEVGADAGNPSGSQSPESGSPAPSNSTTGSEREGGPTIPDGGTDGGTDASDPTGVNLPQAGVASEPGSAQRRSANASAKAELEGGDLAGAGSALAPPRMEKMQRAGWWTLFGALSVSAAGGVMAGLAEREEDRVERLLAIYDPMTGGAPNYASVQDEYEYAQRRGGQFAWASRGLLIAGGAALITSIALFAVHARRSRVRQQASLPYDIQLRPGRANSARLRLISPSAVELRF